MSGAWRWYARQPLAVRGLAAFGITATVFLLGIPLDRWAYLHAHDPRVYEHDWARLLRVQGFVGTWALAALAVWLHERGLPSGEGVARRRAALLLGAALLGGALAEAMKLVLRRARPEVGDGDYVFRGWDDRPWSTAGLALPSSHTLVAFAAATLAARLYPRARWVFYALAWGCGVTRVLAHAHFVSDVTLGAILGWAVGWGLWLRFAPSGAPTSPARTTS